MNFAVKTNYVLVKLLISPVSLFLLCYKINDQTRMNKNVKPVFLIFLFVSLHCASFLFFCIRFYLNEKKCFWMIFCLSDPFFYFDEEFYTNFFYRWIFLSMKYFFDVKFFLYDFFLFCWIFLFLNFFSRIIFSLNYFVDEFLFD